MSLFDVVKWKNERLLFQLFDNNKNQNFVNSFLNIWDNVYTLDKIGEGVCYVSILHNTKRWMWTKCDESCVIFFWEK